MGRTVYIDGRFVPEEEAKVSVFDHGYLYGDGVFEGIRAYNGRVFKLTEHVDRLYDSAKAIMLTIPMSKAEMEETVLETLRRNGLTDAYIRLVVSRGRGDLGLDPRKCPSATVVCIVDKIVLFPKELYDRGIKVMTVATRRNNVDSLSPRIKSLNYLNNILAKIEANLIGCPEVIMLNSEGYVVEGTGDNIFIVKGRKVITPPTHVGILEGITRATVMQMAEEAGYEVREEVFTRHDVYTADECFLTGTAAELIPCIEADGRTIGSGAPGPVTKSLMNAFRKLTHETGTPIYCKTPEAAAI
ncbi:MAG: branched-chain-amino-acid transaminase [Bacillota bacterium]